MKKGIMLLLMLVTIAFAGAQEVELLPGKNLVTLKESGFGISAKSLVEAYPALQMVAFDDGIHTLAYINLFGGIGTDFILYPGKTYELYTTTQLNLFLA